jgi:Predicted spermidine synthase with an N-terminal membrane domain
MSGVRPEALLLVPLAVFLSGWLAMGRDPGAPFKWSILSTGFSEIVFQLMVILAFQSLYGYAYFQVGFILSAFMLGLVAGSWCGLAALRRFSQGRLFRIYLLTQAGITAYPAGLPLAYGLFRDAQPGQWPVTVFAGIFTLLPVSAGLLAGLQYPLANHLVYLGGGRRGGSARPAGTLYALDVFGAAVGALLTGWVLIPAMGLAGCSYFCAALNAAVLLLLLRGKRFLSKSLVE